MKHWKKVYNIAWFIDIAFLVVLAVCIFLWVYLPSVKPDAMDKEQTFYYNIAYYAVMPVFLLGLLPMMGVLNQWAVMDAEGVYTRNVFKVIRRVKWEDVTEIKRIKISSYPIGSTRSQLILIDKEGKCNLSNSINRKGECIKIPAKKGVSEYIGEHFPNIPIIECDKNGSKI